MWVFSQYFPYEFSPNRVNTKQLTETSFLHAVINRRRAVWSMQSTALFVAATVTHRATAHCITHNNACTRCTWNYKCFHIVCSQLANLLTLLLRITSIFPSLSANSSFTFPVIQFFPSIFICNSNMYVIQFKIFLELSEITYLLSLYFLVSSENFNYFKYSPPPPKVKVWSTYLVIFSIK